MNAALALNKLGQHYILGVMVLTRFIGFLGGLADDLLRQPDAALAASQPALSWCLAGCASCMAVATTLGCWACWRRGPCDRCCASSPHKNRSTCPTRSCAGREAVQFCVRYHLHSAVLVPLVTTLPVCLAMWLLEGASADVLVQVCIGTSLGHCLVAAVDVLRHRAVDAAGRAVPARAGHSDRLRRTARRAICGCGMNLSFGMIIVADGRHDRRPGQPAGMDIINHPEQQAETVASLRQHTIYIMMFAVVAGLAPVADAFQLGRQPRAADVASDEARATGQSGRTPAGQRQRRNRHPGPAVQRDGRAARPQRQHDPRFERQPGAESQTPHAAVLAEQAIAASARWPGCANTTG